MSLLPSISFVCCVESGVLEGLTLRLVESVRRWGGSFANAPIYAVTPRPGPELSASTLKAFKHLEVRYLYQPIKSPYSWFGFYNKPLSIAAAEVVANTETVAWLDSDMIIASEPELLWLEDGIDFTACPSEKEMGSCGDGDPFEPVWQAACTTLGVPIDSLPWITSEPDQVRIRLYFNGGLFVYRKSTGFGAHYLNNCTKLMEARIRRDSPDFSIGFNEMSAIGLSVHQLGLKWRPLPYSHNYSINRRSHDRFYREPELRAARVIHHHDSMFPEFWDVFIQCIHSTHPSVGKWLSELGPLRNETSFRNLFWSKALRTTRKRKWRAYIDSCRTV